MLFLSLRPVESNTSAFKRLRPAREPAILLGISRLKRKGATSKKLRLVTFWMFLVLLAITVVVVAVEIVVVIIPIATFAPTVFVFIPPTVMMLPAPRARLR